MLTRVEFARRIKIETQKNANQRIIEESQFYRLDPRIRLEVSNGFSRTDRTSCSISFAFRCHGSWNRIDHTGRQKGAELRSTWKSSERRDTRRGDDKGTQISLSRSLDCGNTLYSWRPARSTFNEQRHVALQLESTTNKKEQKEGVQGANNRATLQMFVIPMTYNRCQ